MAFGERWIEIDLASGPYPRPGSNEVRFFLKKRNPMVTAKLELTEVELWVRYR